MAENSYYIAKDKKVVMPVTWRRTGGSNLTTDRGLQNNQTRDWIVGQGANFGYWVYTVDTTAASSVTYTSVTRFPTNGCSKVTVDTRGMWDGFMNAVSSVTINGQTRYYSCYGYANFYEYDVSDVSEFTITINASRYGYNGVPDFGFLSIRVGTDEDDVDPDDGWDDDEDDGDPTRPPSYTFLRLYSPEETEFRTNGLGGLGEATKCKITEERNGQFELEMNYPVSGKRYKDIANRCIIFCKPNPFDVAQPFRIYQITRPIKGIITVYAAHISYDLAGYPVNPFKTTKVKSAIGFLKSKSIIENLFKFSTDKENSGDFSVTAPSNVRSVLGEILDIYGGEYKFNRFKIRLFENRGKNRGVTIRYGKNLTDLNQEEKCSNAYTGVFPYWQDLVTNMIVQLPENYIPLEGTYNFTNILMLDLTSEFESQPTVDQLREKAKDYISKNRIGEITVSLDVSFVQLEQTEEYKHLVQLEQVELCDTVTVEFPEMGISSEAKVSKTVYNALTGRYDSVTLGTVRSSIQDSIMEQSSALGQLSNSTSGQLASLEQESGDFSGFMNQINGLTESLSSLSEKVSKIPDYTGQINSLTDSVSSLNTELTNLQQTTSLFNTALTNLQQTTASLENSYIYIKEELNDGTGRVAYTRLIKLNEKNYLIFIQVPELNNTGLGIKQFKITYPGTPVTIRKIMWGFFHPYATHYRNDNDSLVYGAYMLFSNFHDGYRTIECKYETYYVSGYNSASYQGCYFIGLGSTDYDEL